MVFKVCDIYHSILFGHSYRDQGPSAGSLADGIDRQIYFENSKVQKWLGSHLNFLVCVAVVVDHLMV